MKYIFLIALFIFPQGVIACEEMALTGLSEKQKTEWYEANPCPMNTDMQKYNSIRKSCIKDKIKNMKMTYEQYIKTPPPGNDVIGSCNHEASINSDRK